MHFLEALQHPNIVRYCHAWVENATFSAFGPEVPTLFILMGFSNAGSLDAFIEGRRGGIDPRGLTELSKAERIRLFRMKKQGAVHLLRLDEILSIFEDIVRGLGFLHDRNILHLDLKVSEKGRLERRRLMLGVGGERAPRMAHRRISHVSSSYGSFVTQADDNGADPSRD